MEAIDRQAEIFRERNKQLRLELKFTLRQVVALLDKIEMNEINYESLEKWREKNGLSEENTAGETVGGFKGTKQGGEKGIGTDSEKGEKGG